MKKTLTRNTLIEILDYAGLDPEDIVYGWEDGAAGYSGRYMCGARCFALSADDIGKVLRFFQGVGSMLTEAGERLVEYPEGNRLLAEMADGAHTDQLGRGSVYYFPSWELEQVE
jgi:hypothetical protein